MNKFKKIPFLFLLLFLQAQSMSAQQIVDQVMAVVGSKIILMSDIEKQYIQFKAQGGIGGDELKCEILDQLVLQKLLLNQAEIDSVEVSDGQVESELDRRMRFYIRQIGSVELLEEYFHTTVRELKAEFRDIIREQLIVQTMQSKITSDVSASPSDVKKYFESIPADSVPYIDAEMEIAQIVKVPVVSYQEKMEIKARLEDFRKKILSGEADFAVYAALYSADPSAKKGGELGFFERGTMVPEFEAAAFNLKPGDVSPVIETKFGFHILQLIERRGEQINVRHILLQPKSDEQSEMKAFLFLDSLGKQIRNGSISFEDAAQKFSDDEETRNNGGLLLNPETNTTHLSPDKIDKTLFFQVDTMPLNRVSRPLLMNTPEGKKAYRIVVLKTRTEPHQANLKDDYQKIQEVAMQVKQGKILDEWIDRKQKTTYININQQYDNCEILRRWERNN